MRDTAPSRPVDGRATIAAPPRERDAPSTKSNWPPMPATWRGPQALRGDLSGEIDLERRVDGDEPVDLRHDRRVVHEAGRLHVHQGIVVHEGEEPLGPHPLGDVEASAMEALGRAGDDAALDERHRRVHQERVHRQIAMAPQRLEHRLGDRADAHLHRRLRRARARRRGADRALDLADRRRRIRREGLVDFTQQSIWLRCRTLLPSVRGIEGFTWAITSGARRAAGRATLTETPRLR
jgi:hypothetical protein